MRRLRILSLLLITVMLFVGCQAAPTSNSKEYPNFNDSRIIPYQHIKHGSAEEYAAVILFEYQMDNYTKYQISYLSCSCRAASANYQHLLYVEINNNNDSAQEATIRDIEFQFWGDSAVNPENGMTYEMIEKEFLPYLIYKSKAEIDAMTTLKDIKDADQVERNGNMYDFVDAYTGATVSVDNTLTILHALFEYHTEKYY
ncbi:hypothetical protein SAMN05446037_1001186 [Anaerovirgula multivorans]|uniref:FMN-binding domain-containing protein n=1 Tax=Anaerovirgula multivorans TaxID=312168 RepID=A0A238ZWX9_9FIRM|nr:hypothetical protein [Anaerovirgula multivorans]SNR87830.1 hypothetical protein SAMN05446037_1001186 [Anaerovirgula multivorans]